MITIQKSDSGTYFSILNANGDVIYAGAANTIDYSTTQSDYDIVLYRSSTGRQIAAANFGDVVNGDTSDPFGDLADLLSYIGLNFFREGSAGAAYPDITSTTGIALNGFLFAIQDNSGSAFVLNPIPGQGKAILSWADSSNGGGLDSEQGSATVIYYSVGGQIQDINLTGSGGMLVEDTINHKGLEGAQDFSASYVPFSYAQWGAIQAWVDANYVHK